MCIKYEEGKVLVQERDIQYRWKKYFHQLLTKDMRYYQIQTD